MMNRQTIYKKWLSTTYKGQDGREIPLCDESTIQSFELVNDSNFAYYAEYQDYYIENKKASSIPSIRAEIIKFLLSDPMRYTPLECITVDALDAYILSRKSSIRMRNTFINKINYLSGFFDYLKTSGKISITFDYEMYKRWADDYPETNHNKAKSLTPKQISEFRYKLVAGSVRFPEYREYLYVFDMKYYTDFEDYQIQSLSIENIKDDHTIIIDNIISHVPYEVINNIIELHRTNKLGTLLTVRQYIIYMKSIFDELDFENLRPKDIKASKNNLSFKCPQCGHSYEAIVDYWCAKEFCDEGKIWIVCKRCGNA